MQIAEGHSIPLSGKKEKEDNAYELPACGNATSASAVESIVFGVIPKYWIMYCRYCSASVSFVTMSS